MSKIPVTVIVGFLGSGKTTLVRHLLANAGGRRFAVIVNEFGDIGVDGDILRGCGADACAEEDIVELANGCICCTVADDFLPTLTRLIERPHPPEHILIETSGLALPKPLLKAFAWPAVRTRTTVDAVVAVVDAEALAEGRFEGGDASTFGPDHDAPLAELFAEQLGCADLVVLNKTDLLRPDTLADAEALVRARSRPGAGLVRAARGVVSPAVLLGLGLGAEDDLASRPSRHEAAGDHDHDDFDSFVLRSGPVADVPQMTARLADSLKRHGVLRLKGVAAVADRPGRLIVQAVGPRVDTYYDRPWRVGEARVSQMVVIGETGMDHAAVGADLRAALA